MAQRQEARKNQRSEDNRVMVVSKKEMGVAPLPKNRAAACSHGKPCLIPASYEISQQTVERVRTVLHEDIRESIAVFKALADPLRLRILKALALEDLCVCVFVELLDCDYSKLSYHLKVLKEAGLVECRPEGTFLIYRLTEFGRAVLGGIGAIEKQRQEGDER
jgi:DNA-binding transcriptional ArsR family regulator